MTSPLRFNKSLGTRSSHLQLGHEDIQLCVIQVQYIHQHVTEPSDTGETRRKGPDGQGAEQKRRKSQAPHLSSSKRSEWETQQTGDFSGVENSQIDRHPTAFKLETRAMQEILFPFIQLQTCEKVAWMIFPRLHGEISNMQPSHIALLNILLGCATAVQ